MCVVIFVTLIPKPVLLHTFVMLNIKYLDDSLDFEETKPFSESWSVRACVKIICICPLFVFSGNAPQRGL
jgi:hypothetical protein